MSETASQKPRTVLDKDDVLAGLFATWDSIETMLAVPALGLGLWLGLGQGTLPLGYGTRPLGAAGFWWALTLSLVLAAVLLVVLLAKESRRGVRRQILLAEGGARGELATLRRGKP